MKLSITLPSASTFILAAALNGQQPLRFAPAFRNYTTDHGLPNNWVYDIYQDNTGYIWIATNNGVCRFDGYAFEQFPDTLHTNLTSVLTGSMTEDSLGRIWYVDFQGRVFYIENEKIHPYAYNHVIAEQMQPATLFHSLIVDGAGADIWLVSSFSGGVLHLWGDGQCERTAPQQDTDMLVLEKNGKSGYCVFSMGIDRAPNINLMFRTPTTERQVSVPMPKRNRHQGGYFVERLSADRWIVFFCGYLYLLQHDKLVWMRHSGKGILQLWEEPDGSLLVGFRQGGIGSLPHPRRLPKRQPGSPHIARTDRIADYSRPRRRLLDRDARAGTFLLPRLEPRGHGNNPASGW